MLMSITMSHQDLTLSNFVKKLTVSDVRHLCERFSNFATYDLGCFDV